MVGGGDMSNIWDDMRSAVTEAKSTLQAADVVADKMAGLLVGRLHHVNPWTLVRLKRELAGFDAHKKDWKK